MKSKIFIGLSFVCLLFSSCVFSFTGYGLIGYYDATGFDVGNADIPTTVNQIDLDWINGSSRIIYYEGDTVLIREEANVILTEKEQVHYRNKDGVLYVKFGAPNLTLPKGLKKDLIIYLPVNSNISNLKVVAASASTSIEGIKVDDVSFNSASGNITANFLGTVKYLDIVVTSGTTNISGDDFTNVKVNSTSGSFKLVGHYIKEFDLDSTSGSVEIVSYVTCDKGDIYSTSGSVKLYLPGDEGFIVDAKSTSGSFYIDSALSYRKSGNMYYYGDCSNSFKIRTTSGSASILKI